MSQQCLCDTYPLSVTCPYKYDTVCKAPKGIKCKYLAEVKT